MFLDPKISWHMYISILSSGGSQILSPIWETNYYCGKVKHVVNSFITMLFMAPVPISYLSMPKQFSVF